MTELISQIREFLKGWEENYVRMSEVSPENGRGFTSGWDAFALGGSRNFTSRWDKFYLRMREMSPQNERFSPQDAKSFTSGSVNLCPTSFTLGWVQL
jgi:hypothetical protein